MITRKYIVPSTITELGNTFRENDPFHIALEIFAKSAHLHDQTSSPRNDITSPTYANQVGSIIVLLSKYWNLYIRKSPIPLREWEIKRTSSKYSGHIKEEVLYENLLEGISLLFRIPERKDTLQTEGEQPKESKVLELHRHINRVNNTYVACNTVFVAIAEIVESEEMDWKVCLLEMARSFLADNNLVLDFEHPKWYNADDVSEEDLRVGLDSPEP